MHKIANFNASNSLSKDDYNKYYKSNFDADIQSKFQYGFIENSIDEIKMVDNTKKQHTDT